MFIVVGLGNPGEKYKTTRHNLGFMVIDYISQSLNIKLSKLKFKALFGEGRIGEEKILLVKPQTFMNLSGESVREICDMYKLNPQSFIVICDDKSLPKGQIRIRKKGSDGGQNGLKSVIQHLGSDEFPRIRIGIDFPQADGDLSNYVLDNIPKADQEIMFEAIEKSAQAVEMIISQGIDKAMNKYNIKKTQLPIKESAEE